VVTLSFFHAFYITHSNSPVFKMFTEVHTGFWWGDLRKGEYLEGRRIDKRIIIKWMFEK
jgi:hypothetical protein